MKITGLQLPQHLSKHLGTVYLVCGEDPFLLQESFSLIRQKAEAAGFKDRMRLDIETDADLELAYNQAYTPPLFNQKRLLELHWKGKLAKAGQQFLINYSQSPARHSLLIVRLGKLDSKTEQTQWFKALEKNSIVVPLWPLPHHQLPAWLMQRAKLHKLELSPEAAERLAHYVEGNLHAGAQEIEKLSLSGESRIDRQMVEAWVVDQGCFNAFDLVDQALAGNSAQALRVLRYLQNEGSEPLLILGALTHELRTLTKLARELKKGSSLSALLSQYRVRMSRQNPVRDFLKRHSDQDCFNFLLKAGEIDRIIKGALPGNIWEALQIFSLQLSGGYSRPSNKHI